MFDPRMLQDPILMALLQAATQQGGQPPSMGAQSNPNILQDPSGVYRNIQPSNEPPAIPFAAPGDWATEQYLQQLAAEQQARQAEIAARQKKAEGELSHSRALELEGMKQTGSIEKQTIQSKGDVEKQVITSLANILDTPDVDMPPQSKVEAIKQLLSARTVAAPQQQAAPANQPVMKAGPAMNLEDPKTQVMQLQQLLDRYTKSTPNAKPTIGTPDPRFAQQGTKDPQMAADIARRIFLFGQSNNVPTQQIVAETDKDPRIPDEIKALVKYYATQYAGRI
jgi:hypothetical protein